MGKHLYEWTIEFYTRGNFLKRVYVSAPDRASALRKLHETEFVLEVLCCRRTITW